MSLSKLRCPLCVEFRGVMNREDVLKHVQKDHGIYVSRCEECEILVDDLTLHEAQVHAGRPYKCPFCNMYFKTVGVRLGHYLVQHPARVGLHSATDGVQLDKNSLPPTGTALQKLMESVGYPVGHNLDFSNEHFVVGLDQKDRPVFTFHVLTPNVVSCKAPLNHKRPDWWRKMTKPPGTDMGHLVPSLDLAHLPNPHETATVQNNWIAMDSDLNQNVWNSLEQHARKLGSHWQEVIVFNGARYEQNSNSERKPIKVGKALLLRRAEEELLMCFAMPNVPVSGTSWSYTTTLKNFCEEMGMTFFQNCSETQDLSKIQNDDIFQCNLYGCTKQFLDPNIAKAHSETHEKKDAKCKKRGKRCDFYYCACLRCTAKLSNENDYKTHMQSKHPDPDKSSKANVDEAPPCKKCKAASEGRFNDLFWYYELMEK